MVGDWHVDCIAIAEAVQFGLGGRVLFLRGGVSTELVTGDDGGWVLRVLDVDGLHRQALSVVRLVVETPEGPAVLPGLKRDPLGILRGRVAERLPNVSRISRAPVVRSDGSVITTSCYDPVTEVLVDLSPDVAGLEVPDHPTDEQVAAAVHLLRNVLFERDLEGGFDGWVFETECDRTHAIALLLTCLLRSAFGVVPLALLNGLQRGVGKGQLLQTIHQIVYGVAAAVSAIPESNAEVEKRITADLLAGTSMILLDEVMSDGVCRLTSQAIVAGLTAPVWAGRILGKSESVSLTQQAVWVATGNNVDLSGDILRRLFQIRMASDRPGLENRSNFRRDLDTWVPEHRRELLTAALTLIRAWYDRGQPEAPRPFGFVSFTEWQRVVGGILHMAGIEDFLGNVQEMREQSDSEAVESNHHLTWVADVAASLPGAPRFTAKEILAIASSDPDCVAPYDRVMEDLDTRGLGRAWKAMAGRWYGDLRIVEDGFAHGNVRAWRVDHAAPADGSAPTPASSAGVPVPGPRPAAGAAPGEVIAFRSRAGFQQEATRAMPAMTGLTIAELGGGDPA